MEANQEQPALDDKQKDRKKSLNNEIEKKRKEIEEKNEQKNKKQNLLSEIPKKWNDYWFNPFLLHPGMKNRKNKP